MKITAIYDNGGRSLDRFTVVTDQPDGPQYVMMLGLAEAGRGVSQWGGGMHNPGGNNRHLDKRIHFEDLSAKTQAHIVARVFGPEE